MNDPSFCEITACDLNNCGSCFNGLSPENCGSKAINIPKGEKPCSVCGTPTSGKLGHAINGQATQDPEGMPVCLDCYEDKPDKVRERMVEFEKSRKGGDNPQ